MSLERLDRISRTRRIVTTGSRNEWSYKHLIAAHEPDQHCPHWFTGSQAAPGAPRPLYASRRKRARRPTARRVPRRLPPLCVEVTPGALLREVAVSSDCVPPPFSQSGGQSTRRAGAIERRRTIGQRGTSSEWPSLPFARVGSARFRSVGASAESGRDPYEAAYLDGTLTVSRFRPFFRRRLNTSRPQRVDIRARNPCLRTRRLLRG